jgi:hypothetical protein
MLIWILGMFYLASNNPIWHTQHPMGESMAKKIEKIHAKILI